MEIFAEIIGRLTALESAQAQMTRVGFVVEVLADEGAVRVECRDADCLKTYVLPVLFQKTRCDKDYWMPDLGEHVLCVFLPYGLERGFVLGAFYSQADVVPVADPDKRHVRFEDGAWVEYDRVLHELKIHVDGLVDLRSNTEIRLNAPKVSMPPPTIIAAKPAQLLPVTPSPMPSPVECGDE